MSQEAPAKSAIPKTLWLILVMASILVIAIAIGLREIRTAIIKPVVYADAGFKKATNTIDPEALRAWALEQVRKNASAGDIAATMPKYIQHLYDEPPDGHLDGSSLDLSWGGGGFHWALYIGDTNDTLPFKSDNQGYPYNFEWRPGIYYTREANLELQ